MFSAIFQRAQATVDSAIGQAINRLIVALPFLIALGFATAALAHWITRELGTELGNFVMSGLFFVIGLVTAAIVNRPAASTAATHSEAADGAVQSRPAADASTDAASLRAADGAIDPELIAAALSSVAPIALPSVVRLMVRNLPLIALIIAVLFVLARQPSDSRSEAGAATT